jgi:hypothetical protein
MAEEMNSITDIDDIDMKTLENDISEDNIYIEDNNLRKDSISKTNMYN